MRIGLKMQDLLFETPGNPIPANAHAGMLTMPDGVRLRYTRFAAEGRPLKGTVLIIPGRNECIEKYFETISDLSRRGLGTAIFDLRGQGGSQRLIRDPKRGYINDFMDYVGDIEPFMEQVLLPDCRAPYFLLAHSTGALIALLSAPVLVNRIQRMVLLTPLLALTGLPVSYQNARRIVGFLHGIGMGTVYATRQRNQTDPYATNILTSDPSRYTRNTGIYRTHPELALGPPTATWVRAAMVAADRVSEPGFIAGMRIPTLIVAAGSDRIVDTRAVEVYARRLRAGSLVTIDGARHELLQEADVFREQLFAAFDAFIPGSNA